VHRLRAHVRDQAVHLSHDRGTRGQLVEVPPSPPKLRPVCPPAPCARLVAPKGSGH
jgi:hypothetical protein